MRISEAKRIKFTSPADPLDRAIIQVSIELIRLGDDRSDANISMHQGDRAVFQMSAKFCPLEG